MNARRLFIPPLVLAAVVGTACADDNEAADTTGAVSSPSSGSPPDTTIATTGPPSTSTSVSVSVSLSVSVSVSVSATTIAATAVVPTSEPDVARRTLDDIVGWLANPSTLDANRFSRAFLGQVPADQLTGIFESLRGEWRVGRVEEGDGLVAAELSGPGEPLEVQLAVDATGRIEGLLFRPVVPPPTSLTELATRVESIPTSALLVARVGSDGACRAIESIRPDTPVPLGSTFKLYVLGAVATAIEAGDVAWDQPVTIRDELDSLPSGTTQDEPDGSRLTVQELATRMISVSDNTATDHLLDLVGRDAVESSLSDFGHADPAVTLPFVTTRELFALKSNRELLERYAAADVDGRRALLRDEVADATLPTADQLWTEPRAVESVEWFASPADVCRVLVELDDRGDRSGLQPIHEILSTNPGVEVDPQTFTRVSFKGGSEPGVIFAAWLAERRDGSRIVVAGGASATKADVDPGLIAVLGAGLELAARR